MEVGTAMRSIQFGLLPSGTKMKKEVLARVGPWKCQLRKGLLIQGTPRCISQGTPCPKAGARGKGNQEIWPP